MTIADYTYLTYSAIGTKEDVKDKIYNISPKDTPFQGMCSAEPAHNRVKQWQIDALAAAAANAQLEGNEIATYTAVVPTTMLSNKMQISYKTLSVSDTENSVDSYGRRREMTYQLVKRSDELKRDCEFVLTNNQAPVTGDSTTAQQLRPLCGWYTTNDNRATVGTPGADGTTSAAATDGTQRPFTEDLLKDVLQKCWIAGGEPTIVMMGAFNKSVASGFTGNNTRMADTQDKRLSAALTFYESDWGTVKFVPNRFSRARDVHVLDPNYWAVSELRAMKTVDLAKTGDAEKAYIVREYTLISRNEAASGIVADLTTS